MVSDEHKVANIDNVVEELADNEDWFAACKAVDEQSGTADHAEIPKRDRNDTFFVLFGDDPLDSEAAEKACLCYHSKNEPTISTFTNYFF